MARKTSVVNEFVGAETLVTLLEGLVGGVLLAVSDGWLLTVTIDINEASLASVTDLVGQIGYLTSGVGRDWHT